MTIGLLRLKLLLAEYGRALMWGLLVAGLLAFGAAGWVYATPPSERVSDQVHRQTVSSVVNTSATVRGNSSLWPTGTELTDQPVYPMAAPQLRFTVRTTVPANERVRVNQSLTLAYRASRDGTTFWQSTRELAATQTTTTDGRVIASATVDVPTIADRLDSYNAELTGLGRAEAIIVLDVTYVTQRYSGEFEKSTVLSIAKTGYWLDDRLAASTVHSEQVTRQVEGEPDRTLVGGVAGLGLLLVGSAGGVWYFRQRDIDRLALQERLDRTRFEEWISEGRLDRPAHARDVPVASLADLVDIAIDSNKRVIHDPARERYAVMDGQVIYRFDPFAEDAGKEGLDTDDRIRESLDEHFDDLPDEPTHDAWDDLLTKRE